jgi:hypothetical protein
VSFGGQTVGFVTVTRSGSPGYLGVKPETRSTTTVSGCRFRPLTSTETPESETDVATGVWKCTAPPEAAALAAKSTGELEVDGVTYRITGPVQPKYDMDGTVHHVTILCQRQES